MDIKVEVKKTSGKLPPIIHALFASVGWLWMVVALYIILVTIQIDFWVTIVSAFPLLIAIHATILYLLGRRWTQQSRSVTDLLLNAEMENARDEITRWLKQEGFKVLEKRADFIKAIKGPRGFGKTYFELTFREKKKERKNTCLLHGEFYSWSPGNPEQALQEAVFSAGGARRKGYSRMQKFLNFLEDEFSMLISA